MDSERPPEGQPDGEPDREPDRELTGRPITIADIARLAGVSTKTVSRALNASPLLGEATRAKVQAVIDETGFVPNAQARALALRRNFLIALVHDGSDQAVADLVAQAMAQTMANGEMALVLHPVNGEPARSLQHLLGRHRPSGVVLLPPLSERADLVSLCAEAGVSCVPLGACGHGAALAANDRAAMAELVDWFVAQGHQRIALIGGPEGSRTAQQRELGYLDAMADHGLDRGPALIEAGDNSRTSGFAAGRLLLELSPRPTAIIACNDAMAAGALQAAGQAGLAVPGELCVVAFDDTALAAMTTPPLSAVHVPWADMAREAVRRILGEDAVLQEPAYPAARLILRGTTPERGDQVAAGSGPLRQTG